MESLLDQTVLKALAHPLRFRVLIVLSERVASPKEVARELDQPLGRVSHHVRSLARMGAIELVETRPRRGALEHFYRATIRPRIDDAEWSALPATLRQSIMSDALRKALMDAGAAAGAAGFEHPLAHTSITLLQLDAQGREEVARLLASVLDEVVAVEARVRERGGGDAEPTELVMLHFDRKADSAG